MACRTVQIVTNLKCSCQECNWGRRLDGWAMPLARRLGAPSALPPGPQSIPNRRGPRWNQLGQNSVQPHSDRERWLYLDREAEDVLKDDRRTRRLGHQKCCNCRGLFQRSRRNSDGEFGVDILPGGRWCVAA